MGKGLPITRLWLDAEDTVPSSYSPSRVVQDIRDAIGFTQQNAPDVPIGIYSANWWWGPKTNNYTGQDICSLPLWVANYRNPDFVPDLSAITFGGWTKDKIDMWQYAGTVDTAGLNSDRNLIIGSTGRMYTDQQIDKKIGALLGAIGANAGDVDVLQGQVAALVAAVADHVMNHSNVFSDEQKAALEAVKVAIAEARLDLQNRLAEAAALFNA